MTAEARTLGRQSDGSLIRYGLETEPGVRLLHAMDPAAEGLAYCGFEPKAVLRPPTVERARSIERMADPQTRGFSWCHECLDALTPQPDPSIWGPPRPRQT